MGETNKLRISIVVPVRNRPDLLKLTLQGLAAQTLDTSAFEVLICDDGSTEALDFVLGDPELGNLRLRLLRQGPLGPATARNLGIRNATANRVLLMDSDVLPETGVVEAVLAAMDANPDWAGAEARLRPCGEGSGPVWTAPASEHGGHYHTAAIAFPKRVLEAVGGMDQDFKMAACEDAELAARVLAQGHIGFVPEALVLHPCRRVTWQHHWRSRHHWRYITIMAVRYGFLAFPGKSASRFPRLRVALCALLTQPLGRVRNALRRLLNGHPDGAVALGHTAVDLAGGLWALPGILFGRIPERKDYLGVQQSMKS